MNEVTNLSNVMMHEISLNYSEDFQKSISQNTTILLNTNDNKAQIFYK
jgi:hypothetical protein